MLPPQMVYINPIIDSRMDDSIISNTHREIQFNQPTGGTPTISRGPDFQRRVEDEFEIQSNDYFCDDQISTIRAMENSLTESESIQRRRKQKFSVNESLHRRYNE